WAPELHKVGGGYRVYFVARHKDTQELCIGVASSDKPAGPFQAAQAPLLRGNKIDPHVFVEETGESYLYWKEDNNDFWRDTLTELLFEHPEFIPILFPSQRHQKGVSLAITLWPWMKRHNRAEHFFQTFLIEAVTRDFYAFEQRLRRLLQESEAVTGMVNRILTELKTPFFVQQLSGDGFSLIGEKIKVLENDQSWEAHVIEGMWVTKRNRTYYMFYAGNNFATSDYAIGIASSESPLGPFKKKKEPFLGSTAKWLAPGHPSVAVGPDGKDRLFLHAYFPDQVGYRQFRAMLAVKLSFKGEWPEIEGIEEIKLPEQL
ncbi:MAG TPA: family 43 glycosylhydrolase, partial [Candidatus Paceibacterota bacterium]|nr:family 43 glycosylhydrolase [Candidatus Paceibacterota bacterium]